MIREADKTEFDKLIEIADNDGFEHPNKITVQWIQNRCMLGDRFYLFIEDDGDIKGFICFQPHFSRGSRLHYLSVKKEEQGKGIGSKLLEEAERMSMNHDKSFLYLWAHQRNKKAISFYLKHDFNFAGIFLNKYGDGENALLMCKELI